MKQAAEGLVQANLGIRRAVEAAMSAKDEHENLRDTVQRLETLVIDLTKEVRELRSRIQ